MRVRVGIAMPSIGTTAPGWGKWASPFSIPLNTDAVAIPAVIVDTLRQTVR